MGLEALSAAGCKAIENARGFAGVFFSALLALALSGCASLFPQTAQLREGLPGDLPEHAELKSVPFFAQTEYECGPASLAMVLNAAGAGVTPEQLVPEVYLPERKGSLQVEMLAATRRHGLISYLLAPRFSDLLREIAAGNPVVVLQDLAPVGTYHYAVAVGYDYESGKIFLRSGEDERQALIFPVFEFTWLRTGYWAMVAVPPDRIPATAEESRWLASVAALERTGDARGARTAYEAFLKRWPGNIDAAIGLANARYALKDLPGAEAVLREAARHDPGSVIVLNNLSQTLLDQDRAEEALPFIERAAAAGGPYAGEVAKTKQQILARLADRRR